MPTESLAIIYHDTQNMSAYKIPDFSNLSPGTHHINARPMWSWPGPDQSSGTAPPFAVCTTNETIYNPHSAQELNLYYIKEGVTAEFITVTVSINTSAPDDSDWTEKPDEPPGLKQKCTAIGAERPGASGFFCRKGLYFDVYFDEDSTNDGMHYMVIPLKSLALHGPKNILRMFVSCKEIEPTSRGIHLDVDEATGRVIVWGWNEEAQETTIFVGNLV
jgi:hypothetical protein